MFADKYFTEDCQIGWQIEFYTADNICNYFRTCTDIRTINALPVECLADILYIQNCLSLSVDQLNIFPVEAC